MNTILTNNLPLESKIQLLCGLGLPVDGVQELITNKILTLSEVIENSLIKILTQINSESEFGNKGSSKYNLKLVLSWFNDLN